MQKEPNIMSFRASDGNTIKLEHHESLPSALSLAKEYALAGYPDRYVVFAESQTEESAVGRTVSESSPEKGLYISCILRPSLFRSQAGCLGALSAVALASALEEHTNKKIGIGWVGDIYCDGYKIGCTSIKNKHDNHVSFEYIIVSFMVKLDPRRFPPRLTDMVRQVFDNDNVSISTLMAKTVINKFFSIYREIKNPAKHLNHYTERFVLTGKKIKYIENGKKKSAKIVGINKNTLSLIIETRDGSKIDVPSPSSVIIPAKTR